MEVSKTFARYNELLDEHIRLNKPEKITVKFLVKLARRAAKQIQEEEELDQEVLLTLSEII